MKYILFLILIAGCGPAGPNNGPPKTQQQINSQLTTNVHNHTPYTIAAQITVDTVPDVLVFIPSGGKAIYTTKKGKLIELEWVEVGGNVHKYQSIYTTKSNVIDFYCR